jgi:carboxylate-amine ligase
VANRIEDALAAVPPNVASHASRETHACVLELRTAPHLSAGGAAGELADLRQSLDAALRDRLGLKAAGTGTHPLAVASDVALTSSPRYRDVARTMRMLAEREPTMALHVHVAVPDPAAAVRVLDGLRGDLPVLLALSANSPYARGADSGFASARTPIFSGFPRVGIPRRFGSYDAYVGAIEPLIRSGAVPEPSFLWWDARLQPRLGTVEVRIMDAQTHVADVAALAALVQCLVVHRARGPVLTAAQDEVIAENRFLAARDGMEARLVDEAGSAQPVRARLAALLDECADLTSWLGCGPELAAIGALAEAPGNVRQRAYAALAGVAGLPAWLAGAFVEPARATAGARAPAVA